MTRKSVIDDVSIRWNNKKSDGPQIIFSNQEIRRMLHLVNAGKDDVIWDLGCGWAQNLIVAVTEFGVEKCIGIEMMKSRFQKAKERIINRSLSKNITIYNQNFMDKNFDKGGDKLEDATIILWFLSIESKEFRNISERLSNGCKLVYQYHSLIPEIKPDYIDYPFYVSVFPFKKPRSTFDWIKSVVQKSKSTIIEGKQPTEEELWDELSHDYNVIRNRKDAEYYKERLKLL